MENKNPNIPTSTEQPVFGFNSPSFVKYKKNKTWYLVIGVLIVLLIIAGILTRSSTFPIAVLVFAMVYLYVNHDDPVNIDFLIYQHGIKVGSKFYSYTDLKTFWIEYDPPYYQSLHFVQKGDYKEDITVQFHGIDPAQIRFVLVNFLPEWEERTPTITERIIRFLGL